MGLRTFLNGLLFGEVETASGASGFDDVMAISMNELAFNVCVNLVANAISKCEIKVYKNGKQVKDDNYYLWNVKPNRNQSANAFWGKLIYQLYSRNEALVYVSMVDGSLFVADDFQVTFDDPFKEMQFSNVKIENRTLSGYLLRSQVYYFKLNNQNIQNLMSGLTTMYKKLIVSTYKKAVRNGGQKGILNIDATASNATPAKKYLETKMPSDFKTFYEAENGVLPLYNGMTYQQLNTTSGSLETSKIINDYLGVYAKAFNIPPMLITGDVQDTEVAMKQLLTFCIDPLIELLSDEINGSKFSKEDYQKGNYIKFDTLTIKHIDLLEMANNIDKLVASGFNSINEIRKYVGLDELDEAWANEHFITKNYENVKKGGDG